MNRIKNVSYIIEGTKINFPPKVQRSSEWYDVKENALYACFFTPWYACEVCTLSCTTTTTHIHIYYWFSSYTTQMSYKRKKCVVR